MRILNLNLRKTIFPNDYKNSLVKALFIYYYKNNKEFQIFGLISRTLLIFSLFLFAFCSNVFAGLKTDVAEEYRLKGYEAKAQGKLDEALSCYIKAVSVSPKPAYIYNDMGVVYEKMKLGDKAEDNYLEAIRLDPQCLPALTNLAYFYEKQGDLEKAAEYLQRRIEGGDLNDPWTRNAQKKLDELSQKSPKLARLIKQKEVEGLKQQVINEAKDDFNKQVSMAKEFFEKGRLLEKQKKYNQAIDEYNQALSFTPQNPKILRARDQVIFKLTKEKAREYADSALKMLEVGDTVSAKLEFQKILAIIPNEPVQISE